MEEGLVGAEGSDVFREVVEVLHGREETRQARSWHLDGASRELLLGGVEEVRRSELEEGLNGCLYGVCEFEGERVESCWRWGGRGRGGIET